MNAWLNIIAWAALNPSGVLKFTPFLLEELLTTRPKEKIKLIVCGSSFPKHHHQSADTLPYVSNGGLHSHGCKGCCKPFASKQGCMTDTGEWPTPFRYHQERLDPLWFSGFLATVAVTPPSTSLGSPAGRRRNDGNTCVARGHVRVWSIQKWFWHALMCPVEAAQVRKSEEKSLGAKIASKQRIQ